MRCQTFDSQVAPRRRGTHLNERGYAVLSHRFIDNTARVAKGHQDVDDVKGP